MKSINNIIEIKNLSKHFGATKALDNVNLVFERNKIYGLFGRNGAGKSTLLDIIASHRFADKGNIEIDGYSTSPEKAVPGLFCYMPERDCIPERINVSTLLKYAKTSYPNFDAEYADRLCTVFGLDKAKRFGQLSRGHQSYVRIVIGLASMAPVTILDEPVLGLDAVARDKFYSELINSYSNDPRLFIISTHFIEESSDLFNEAIILNEGSVLMNGSVDELLAHVFYVRGKTEAVMDFAKECTLYSEQSIGGVCTAVIQCDSEKIRNKKELTFSKMTMQQLFINVAGESTDKELEQ